MEKTMALDGIVIANITNELNKILTGSRITKIAQPEKDELLLTIKQSKEGSDGKTIRSKHMLVISVNPSLPLIYLTEDNKTSPLQAPTFCMVLRKHLNNCRIVGIEQIGLERLAMIEKYPQFAPTTRGLKDQQHLIAPDDDNNEHDGSEDTDYE